MTLSKEMLNERVATAIQGIATVADQIPGVIIIHQLPDFIVKYMSPRGLQKIGKTAKEVENMSNQEYHDQFFNPDDAQDYVPKILDLINRNTDDEVSFFQQVRTSTTQDFDWYLSAIRILLRDSQNRPILTITTAMQIDPNHHISGKVSRLLEENNFLRKNFESFSKLSDREKQVLKLLALGKTAAEISEVLVISVATAETHRKNIKKKLAATSGYELSLYARAFNLI
jgi:DNA-binding CsgD family transcriptional regulator